MSKNKVHHQYRLNNLVIIHESQIIITLFDDQ